MAMNDTLASGLSKIHNAEQSVKDHVIISPYSKILRKILDIANEQGYVGKYELIPTVRGGEMKVHLLNKINKCGAIKPRFSVTLDDYEKYEKRYLPAKDFGILFVSTTKGILSHVEAKKLKLGGVLLAYLY